MDYTFYATMAILLAYFIGSLSSAIIVSRMFDLPDPREEGSKNPGATNVLRLGGKKFAAVVLVFDVLKGLLPVLCAYYAGIEVSTLGYVGLASVIGHMYPIYYRFHGGKGVATTIGAYLGLHLFVGLSVAAIWLIVSHFYRYSSLASLISITLAPIVGLIIAPNPGYFVPMLVIVVLVIFKHRENIQRLLDGTEPKIGQRSAELKSKQGTEQPVETEFQQDAEATIIDDEEEPSP